MEKTIYLYLKTHNKTGLKYLGKTAQDPYKYRGSGKHWRAHLKKHGNDVTTEILFQTSNENDIERIGLEYSEKWNIVESTNFANLIPESGTGGTPGVPLSADHKQKISASTKGKANRLGTKLSAEHKQKISEASKGNTYMLGKTHSCEAKIKISESNKGKVRSKETRKKISDAKKGIPKSEDHKRKLSELRKNIQLSAEHKQKISDAMKGEHNPFYGQTHSEEVRMKISESHKGTRHSEKTKQKMSLAKKGKLKPTVICPICGAEGGEPAMKRWHFENCKTNSK